MKYKEIINLKFFYFVTITTFCLCIVNSFIQMKNNIILMLFSIVVMFVCLITFLHNTYKTFMFNNSSLKWISLLLLYYIIKFISKATYIAVSIQNSFGIISVILLFLYNLNSNKFCKSKIKHIKIMYWILIIFLLIANLVLRGNIILAQLKHTLYGAFLLEHIVRFVFIDLSSIWISILYPYIILLFIDNVKNN